MIAPGLIFINLSRPSSGNCHEWNMIPILKGDSRTEIITRELRNPGHTSCSRKILCLNLL